MPSSLGVMNARRRAFAAHCNVSLCASVLGVALVSCVLSAFACGSEPAPARAPADSARVDAGNVIHQGPTSSDGGVDDAGRVTPELDPTLACIEYLRGLCERAVRCDGVPEYFDLCMASARFCPDVMFAPGSTRTVEGTWACADGWRELACDARPSIPACATRGTRAVGEPCIASMQCQSQLCTAYGDSCGVCVEVGAEGQACDDVTVGCDDHLYCSSETPRVCVPTAGYPLAPPLPLGAECEPSASVCGRNDCRADDEGIYRCSSYPTLGQYCGARKRCATGDSYCDISLVCTAFPALGESCGVDALSGNASRCGPDAMCVGEEPGPRTCQARPAPGEPCEGACAEGHFCQCDDSACETRSCTRWRYPGESCTSAGDRCLAGDCEAGTCRAHGERGLFESACQADASASP